MDGVFACHGPSHPMVIARYDIPMIIYDEKTTTAEEKLLISTINNSLSGLRGHAYFAPEVESDGSNDGLSRYRLFADNIFYSAYKKKLTTTAILTPVITHK